MQLRLWMALLVCMVMTSCGSHHRPAPVRDLTTPASTIDPLAPPTSVVVRKGDTLYSIAFLYHLDFADVARYNGFSPSTPIRAGQRLRLTPPPKQANASRSQMNNGQYRAPSQPTGQTSNQTVKQPVDRPKTREYGEVKSEENNSSDPLSSSTSKQKITWTWPAQGQVVARFSLKEQGNKGIDIANRAGTPVVAAADGKVVYTGDALRGFGNLVIIRHSDDYLTAYAHNQSIEVKEQQWVKAGQQIALMGKSGTDSVKLHFEIRFRGRSVDPSRFLPRR